MDGAVIFFFVLAFILVAFAVGGLIAVTKAKPEGDPDRTGSLQQRLIDINKVPDPKGRGTVWTPSE